ncbi:MAG: acyl-CoA thioesterase [Gammaproteobacteria bacterium]|nr:acyl-CoA thioesterase [Gammaproteobacteria bacterium]
MMPMKQMTDELPNREPDLRVVAMPSESNTGGSIFGGWLMGQVDIAAGILAIQRAGGRVATVAVNNFHFEKPVLAGDLVSCYAEVSETGKTSMTIHVDVFAQRNMSAPETFHAAEADLSYVALDENRQPRPVPAPDSMEAPA